MNNRKNIAAYLTGVRKIEIRECEVPKVASGEVLIEMEYVGICGSDIHFFEECTRKGMPISLPLILGHEGSGTVVEIGENVTELAVGDRVCIEPQKTCNICKFCKSGHYNMCPHVQFPSVPPYDGMMRKYFAFPAHLCHKLPQSVTFEEGALIEPFAVGMSAAWKGGVTVGETVVILGMGTIGLTTLLACKARGASSIIAVDLYENRLKCAKEFGAAYTINAKETDPVQKVMEITQKEGCDVVFETAGSPFTASQSVNYLKRCGKIVFVGNINGQTPFDFMELMYKEGSINTIYRYRNNFSSCITAAASKTVQLEDMKSAVYDLKEAQKAFECSSNDKANVIKVLVKIKEDGI